jgi:hypothetical protein
MTNEELENENKRLHEELTALAEAVIKYNSLRDDEWDFDDEHGDRDFWDADTCDEHDELLGEILSSRKKVAEIVRKVLGKPDLAF